MMCIWMDPLHPQKTLGPTIGLEKLMLDFNQHLCRIHIHLRQILSPECPVKYPSEMTVTSESGLGLLQHVSNRLKTVFLYALDFLFLLSAHILLGWIWLLVCMCRCGAVAASKFVPRLGRPLSPIDVILTENYNERHVISIVATMVLQGDTSAEAVQQSFSREVLQAKITINDDSSKLKFPELMQYQKSFLGVPFWRDDPNFQIQNHIQQVFHDDKDTPAYFHSLESMASEFTGRAYAPKRSPWELWIVRNFSDGGDGSPKTVFMWRAHHTLMDGYSMLNLLNNFLGNTPVPVIHAAKAKVLTEKVSSWNILSFLRGYRTLLSQVSQNKATKRSISAARGRTGEMVTDKTHFRYAPKLPLDQVKRVAAHFGVRVPALLATLVADSVSQVVQAQLDDVHAFYAIPLPNHPGTLVNHALVTTLQLPMSKSQPITAKLMSTNESFLRLKSNPVSGICRYLSIVLGNCPPPVSHFATSRGFYAPFSITNFAVGSEGFQCDGMECLEMSAGLGVPMNFTGCTTVIVGYKNQVQILFAGHDSLYSEDDAERIALGIGKNWEKLAELTLV